MSLIVALDPPEKVEGIKWSTNLVEELSAVVKSFNIGLPLVLE